MGNKGVIIINLAGIQFDCTNIYDGIAVEIYISGCNRHCKGCHNPEMQDFDYGKEIWMQDILSIFKDNNNWFDIISIMGGDLLCHKYFDIVCLLKLLHENFPDKKLWLFTGANLSEIPPICYEYFDVIKYGRYIEELHDDTYELASTNQRFIKKGIDY